MASYRVRPFRSSSVDDFQYVAFSDAAWLRWGYLHTDHHLRQFGA